MPEQPKGVLDAAILYEGAQVGDVVRVDAEFEIDGIVVTSVMPPRASRTEPERLEVIGPPREQRAVTSSLTSKRDRGDERRRDRGRDDDRRPATKTAVAEHRRARRAPTRHGPSDRLAPSARRGERPDRAATVPRPAAPSGQPRARARPTAGPRRVRSDCNRSGSIATRCSTSLAPEQRPSPSRSCGAGCRRCARPSSTRTRRPRAAGEPMIKPDALLAMAEELLPRLQAGRMARPRRGRRRECRRHRPARPARRRHRVGGRGARRCRRASLASTLREALQRRSEEHRTTWLSRDRAVARRGPRRPRPAHLGSAAGAGHHVSARVGDPPHRCRRRGDGRRRGARIAGPRCWRRWCRRRCARPSSPSRCRPNPTRRCSRPPDRRRRASRPECACSASTAPRWAPGRPVRRSRAPAPTAGTVTVPRPARSAGAARGTPAHEDRRGPRAPPVLPAERVLFPARPARDALARVEMGRGPRTAGPSRRTGRRGTADGPTAKDGRGDA